MSSASVPPSIPPPDAGSHLPRAHALALAAILVVGLVRGLFWVAVTEVFSPLDEAAHYGYVATMAERFRPPVVGKDRLPPEALRLQKLAATSWWRPAPVSASADDDRWMAGRESYEGVQGPTYYALMAVPYRLARSLGVLATVYVLRVATVLVALTAVPLAWLLARELVPEHPGAWLAAPALLVLVQGFNANLAAITNDALVVPLAAACLLPVASALRRGPTQLQALATGALTGLVVVTKTNALALAPLVGLGATAALIRRHSSWRDIVRWGAVAGGTAAAVVAPWVAWNFAVYGEPSAASAVDRVTGPLQPPAPSGLAGVAYHLLHANEGFWDLQLRARPMSAYATWWWAAATVLLVSAVALSVWRRHGSVVTRLIWLAAAWPLTALVMLIVIFVVFDGRSSTVGRHLYPALVATVVTVGVSAFVLAGTRRAWVVVAAVGAVALVGEVGIVHRYLLETYTDGVIGRLVPVVDQALGDSVRTGARFSVTPPCPTDTLGIGFVGEPPPEISVVALGGGARLPAALVAEQRRPLVNIGVYGLARATSDPFEVVVPPAEVTVSGSDHHPRVALVPDVGDPVARVYCPVRDPRAARFAQLFHPEHPDLRYGVVRAWPVVWAAAGWAAVAGMVAAFGVSVARNRRG